MSQIETRIEALADQLERQTLDASITDGTIWNLLTLSKSSFYRLKPKALALVQQRAQERQKAIDLTKTQETIDAAKKGLKSKNERVMLLQEQIEGILDDLRSGILVDYMVIGGSLQKVNKIMPADTKAYLRKTIKDIQAEISKIEGDYAPAKTEDVTDYQVIRPVRR